MYPYLLPGVFHQALPMYDLMIGIGLFAMLIYVAGRLEKYDGYSRKQTNRLLVLLVISLLVALVFSYLFDGVFHSIENGEWTFGSITFIGGLIGGVVGYLILLKFFYKDKNKNVRKIMNTVLTGVVLAHAFGRIGCLMSGCCYGIPTDSFLGVVFPYGDAAAAFPHTPVYPTQLFESLFLFALFFVLNYAKRLRAYAVETYLIAYGVWRILIEFIRGDDRGSLLPFYFTPYNAFPTPSQYLSVLMILLGLILLVKRSSRIKSEKDT